MNAAVPRVLLAIGLAAVALAPAACEHKPKETKETAMTFMLTSPAFANGERIPKQYTGEGTDSSPPLEWTDPPDGTQSLALICDDPDAPAGTWDHWLIWNIPADRRNLPEGIPATETVADLGGACQGNNSWPKIGYGGPMPPPGHGVHHYHFRLYALDTALELAPGADKTALLNAMEGHILAEAKLTGLYSR